MGVRAPCATTASPQFEHFPPEKAHFREPQNIVEGNMARGRPPGENLIWYSDSSGVGG